MTTSRRKAREAALRALYFWEVGRTTPEAAIDGYFAEHDPESPEPIRAFATELVLGTAGEVAALDALITAHAEHWRVDRLAVVDRLILRMAAWELQHAPDTPPAVVLNEAIELARRFGTSESPRFVNGVLDAIRKTIGGQ